MSSIEIHGVRIVPMSTKGAGSKDLVHHVYKHFLAAEWLREWARVPPDEALTPTELCAEAASLGILPSAYDEDKREPRWWTGKRRQLAQRAHREGYQPRYLELLRRAGPQGRGGAWFRDERPDARSGDWYAVSHGFRIGGYFTKKFKVFHVVTAYRRTVLRARPPKRATPRAQPAFEALLDKRCPGWRDRRVQEVHEPKHAKRNES